MNMANIIVSGLTTITTFSLLSDGWDNMGDLFDDFKKVGCWFRHALPDNKFVRFVVYTGVSVLCLRSLPFLLRRTSFFGYFDQEVLYFHRGNNEKEILEFKQELLRSLQDEDPGLPLFHNTKLVILELNVGGGTNFSYYPRGCYVIGTDIVDESRKQLESNMLVNDEEGSVKKFRFLNTMPEELNCVPDNSVSCVVSFHALCSTYKTARALAEIKRVLMPGGKLLFIEHVSVPSEKKWSWLWIAQMNFRPSLISLNCCIKSTEWYIDTAGFSNVQYTKVNISGKHFHGPLKALIPHIYGYAIK